MKISILISAYNMENMIHDALDSAINQTMKDIEIIVIDNYSTDTTREIVKKYQQKDTRIRLIELPTNTGLLNSHIVAGHEAQGEYLVYLDADDRLNLEFCKKMYDTITSENVDMVQCQIAIELYEQGSRKNVKGVLGNNFQNGTILKGTQVIKERLKRNLTTPLWGKIFKKEFYLKALELLTLPKDLHLTFAEDTIQSYPMYYLCQSHYSLGEKLYHYTIVENSESRRVDKAYGTLQQIAQFISIAHDFFKKYKFNELYKEEVVQEKKHMADLILLFFPYLTVKEIKILPLVQMIQQIDPLIFIEVFSQKRSYNLDQKITNLSYPDNPIHSQKKKIAFYINRMYNGGVERCLAKKINLLIDQGYEVILFTVEEEKNNDYDYSDKATRIVLGKDATTHLSKLYHYIQEYKIEILEICDYFIETVLNVALLAKLMNITVIFAYHANLDTILQIPSVTINIINIGKIVDIVTCLSRIDMLSWKMYGVNNVVYIPNILSFDEQIHVKNKINNNLVFVARIDPYKGIFDLINAMPLVVQAIQDVKLTIVGGSSYLNDNSQEKLLYNTIQQLKMEKYIECVGFQKDVTPYLKEASIFCCPTYADSWNMSYAEAKTYGLATVVSDLPNLELYDPSDSLQFELGNVNDLAHQLIYLLKNPDLIKQMGKAATDNIQQYNNSVVIDEYNKLLCSIHKGELNTYITEKYQSQLQNNFEEIVYKLGQQRSTVLRILASDTNMGTLNIFQNPKLKHIRGIAEIFCPPNSKRRIFMKKFFISIFKIYRKIKLVIHTFSQG